MKGLSRFRANIFLQRGAVAGAFRMIPFKILSFEDIGLPPIVGELGKKPSGLVLVTGPTGSGKSTTLAAIIDKINAEQRVHILTVEDPIEYLHPHKLSIVNQREVGTDTEGFKNALKYVLRQDPDVVLIGEMRDLETIEAALTISETGHLVFATLHTNSAVSTINRIIDVFPPHQQAQIRSKLSFVLQGVVSQQLIPRNNAPGRVMALEVLIPNQAIRNLIREDKIHQIYSQMQVGQDKYGMVTLNQSLYSLFQRKFISQGKSRRSRASRSSRTSSAHDDGRSHDDAGLDGSPRGAALDWAKLASGQACHTRRRSSTPSRHGKRRAGPEGLLPRLRPADPRDAAGVVAAVLRRRVRAVRRDARRRRAAGARAARDRALRAMPSDHHGFIPSTEEDLLPRPRSRWSSASGCAACGRPSRRRRAPRRSARITTRLLEL